MRERNLFALDSETGLRNERNTKRTGNRSEPNEHEPARVRCNMFALAPAVRLQRQARGSARVTIDRVQHAGQLE